MKRERAGNFAPDFIARVKSAREAAYSRSEIEALLKLPKGAYKKYETCSLLPHHLVLRFCLLTGTDPYELFGAPAEKPVAHIHH
jgi:hypothetical protein